MSKILMLVLSMILCSCYQTISKNHIDVAETKCKNNEGLVKIVIYEYNIKIECSNGAHFWEDVK